MSKKPRIERLNDPDMDMTGPNMRVFADRPVQAIDGKTTDRALNIFDNNAEFVPPSGFNPLPARHSEQSVVLYHVCHEAQRPQHHLAGINILGLFPSTAAARDFVHQHHPEPTYSLFVSDTHTLFPIRVTHTNQVDHTSCGNLADEVIALHKDHIQARKHDFDQNVEDMKTGATGTSLFRQLKESRERRQFKTFDELQGSNEQLRGDQTIAGQKYVVLITLDDIRPATLSCDQPEEPLISILYAGDLEDCRKYAQYTASKVYQDCDIRVAAMYKWLFPSTVDQENVGEVLSANPRLEEIIHARRETQKKIQEFDEFYSVVDIPEADLKQQSHPAS